MKTLTVESVDAFLTHVAGDAAIDSFISVAVISQEVLQNVQHTSHLSKAQAQAKSFSMGSTLNPRAIDFKKAERVPVQILNGFNN